MITCFCDSRAMRRVFLWMGLLFVSLVGTDVLFSQDQEKVSEVEGISEYRLSNGVPVLLFPDSSKPNFTINMTVMVGSRHEGYGETGMAHLLEHMLFKGTPTHPDIPKLLKDRGVLNMNGTTWYDRTNYYETLPSNDENLEFAIRMEADRLLNSTIKAEDLASEMTVVRNEFEMGENEPFSILMQRMMATSFEWHNYGKTTIGNRSDIERVPIENLRAFYRKYYQPDNIMVVLAGQFPQDKALALLQKYFGTLKMPERELPKTYTEEPIQDGERTVTLRRVGDVQMVGSAYHIPSAADANFAALDVFSRIMGDEPAGRLYKRLVTTNLASNITSMIIPGHDPGVMLTFCEVSKSGDLEAARLAMIEEYEQLEKQPVTAEEVKRAVQAILKEREQQFADTESMAIQLSEYRAYGDWKLFFYHRDQLEKVTAADVQRVAQQYFVPSNRTVGLFVPTDKPVRAPLPAIVNPSKMLADYQGRKKLSAGEEFDPTPENIDARTQRLTLPSGVQVAALAKKTRGDRVFVNGQLRYGNLEALRGKKIACEMLPELLSRGTKNRTFQQIQDRLDELRATLSLSGSPGKLNFNIQTKRENLADVIGLLREILREPAFDSAELEIVKRQTITQLESGKSDPQALAANAIQRKFSDYAADDPRYVPTIDEEIEWTRQLTVGDLQAVYSTLLSGQTGDIAMVGDFDTDGLAESLAPVFDQWTSKVPYSRIVEAPKMDVPGQQMVIETPDKANAIYLAAIMTPLNDQHPDFESMVVGNYIMGGGPLSSRLADSVRKEKGLSYGVGSMFQAHPVDERGIVMVFAISNPENSPKVMDTINQEVKRLVESGVGPEELERAKASYLETRKGARSDEGQLASTIRTNLEYGRTMESQLRSETKIGVLTKDQVDQTLKRWIAADKLVIIRAGDFKKPADDSSSDK